MICGMTVLTLEPTLVSKLTIVSIQLTELLIKPLKAWEIPARKQIHNNIVNIIKFKSGYAEITEN